MANGRMGLVGTLALLAATVAAVFGVALTRDDPATPVDRAPEDAAELDSDALLKLSVERTPQVARRVAEIRGVEFEKIPVPQVTDSEELRELAEKEIAKPKVAETLAAGDAQLKLLGLLDAEESLAEIATDVTADAAAYYDPKKEELFMLGDAVPAGAALAEFVLAHELTHALEDQVFGLPRSSASSDDRVLAESALVEGTATSLMLEYAAEHLELSELLDETTGLGGDTGGIPQIALAQVTFTYFGGQRFIDELKASADGNWDLVDFAYERRPPETTEQILHADKYFADEASLSVPPAGDPGPAWERIDSGTVGEFFTRELLRQDADELGADEAAAGWGGDKYTHYRRKGAPAECSDDCREDNALVTVWRGDDEDEAAELREALEDFIERVLDGEGAGTNAWELDGGWAALGGDADVVALALAPNEETASRLATVR